MGNRPGAVDAPQSAIDQLLENQTYEEIGLRTSQRIGLLFDRIVRHTLVSAPRQGEQAALPESDRLLSRKVAGATSHRGSLCDEEE